MLKSTSFWTGALSSFAATGAKRIALIITVALFCWVTATVVGSLAASQIVLPVAWAQSESPEEQGSALLEGENGILLIVRQNGKVIQQKMVVRIKTDQYQ